MSSAEPSTAVAAQPIVREGGATAHVHQLVQKSKSSFYWGMRLLPAPRRQAMYAIYSFCRAVDDVADEPGKTADKLRALADWRKRIQRLYAGQAECPITRALIEPVGRFDLPQEEFHLLIDGVEIDAAQSVRMRRMEDLLDYCRKVAGAVGMLSIRAFGVPQHPGPRIAVALGNAMQLTNILRDIAEDAAIQRLYVPEEILQNLGVCGKSVRDLLKHPRFPTACADLAKRARGYYEESDGLLVHVGRRAKRPVSIMMEVYRRQLKMLDARGWRRLAEPVSPGRWRKLGLALRHGFF